MDINRTKTGEFERRAAYLQKMIDSEKDASKHRQESLHILNVLENSLGMASEHIDRFIDRIEQNRCAIAGESPTNRIVCTTQKSYI